MPTLLEAVAAAADDLRRIEEERERARDRLGDAVRRAHEESVPLATIARAAGYSRQRLRLLLDRR